MGKYSCPCQGRYTTGKRVRLPMPPQIDLNDESTINRTADELFTHRPSLVLRILSQSSLHRCRLSEPGGLFFNQPIFHHSGTNFPFDSGSTAWLATSSSKNSARPSWSFLPITLLATAATSGLAFPIATPSPALAIMVR